MYEYCEAGEALIKLRRVIAICYLALDFVKPLTTSAVDTTISQWGFGYDEVLTERAASGSLVVIVGTGIDAKVKLEPNTESPAKESKLKLVGLPSSQGE